MSLEPPFTSVYTIYDPYYNLYSKIRQDLFFIDARVSVRLSIINISNPVDKTKFSGFFLNKFVLWVRDDVGLVN